MSSYSQTATCFGLYLDFWPQSSIAFMVLATILTGKGMINLISIAYIPYRWRNSCYFHGLCARTHSKNLLTNVPLWLSMRGIRWENWGKHLQQNVQKHFCKVNLRNVSSVEDMELDSLPSVHHCFGTTYFPWELLVFFTPWPNQSSKSSVSIYYSSKINKPLILSHFNSFGSILFFWQKLLKLF